MDVLCQAKSGMGKTAVFVLSTLQQIEPSPGQVIALVLCHTRELAYQICHEFERFSTYLPDIKVAVFYGGVNIRVHKDLLKNECPHIVVGTPGRILALARDKDLSLKNVRHFILDECDKMLESLDMRRDVQEIFKMTPHDKQVMMFSATLSKEIRPVCKKFMQDPMEIYVDDEAKLTLHGLVQHYIKLSELEKNRKLNDLLDALDFNQVVIFVKSVNRAAELNKLLVECNFPSICIHSGMSQEERLTRYKGFKEGHKRILVATDLVGRGIDIEHTDHLGNTALISLFDEEEEEEVEALIIFLILCIGSSNLSIGNGQNTFDVVKFGAVGDGKTDDSPAFLKAWQALCGATGEKATLEIAASKTFLLSQVEFVGPCSSNRIDIQILGKIVAPSASAWSKGDSDCWLCFSNVNGLVVDGSGQIDGNGATWWNKALHFHRCDNLKLSGLTHLNSQKNHIGVHNCNGVSISNLHIIAPADSPNTDGIDISSSTQVLISDSFIGTGDDCIAIKGGTSDINVTKVTCGPGHGISIGSLGEGGANDQVQQVHVTDCTFNATQNGARIKTTPGGSGFAREISFEQITLIASRNPIDIDQHYCNGNDHRCPDVGKAVAVSGVTFRGFHGTCAVNKAINLDCSNKGCSGITIDNVNITSCVQGMQLQAICNNAHGRATTTVPVISCLFP
ncbi:hypothetical protein CRYUN_Cryun02cG0059400 [Craigia yunnanensis]